MWRATFKTHVARSRFFLHTQLLAAYLIEREKKKNAHGTWLSQKQTVRLTSQSENMRQAFGKSRAGQLTPIGP